MTLLHNCTIGVWYGLSANVWVAYATRGLCNNMHLINSLCDSKLILFNIHNLFGDW